MKKDKIIYLVQSRLNNEHILQEKKGYLIRIEAIEPGEYLYFLAAHDIDETGKELPTWGIDEYYTGCKIFEGYPTRYVAILALIQFWQQGRHEVLIRKINDTINYLKSKSKLANLNPENYKYSINDLSYMAYGRRVTKHGK